MCVQYDEKKGRWDVRLDDHSDGGEVVSLKPSSLTVMRSFASVVRADAAIVASLGRSVAASAAHIASEEAAVGEHGVCPHTHLEEWHGAPEPFHCKRCKAAVTDGARVEQERRRAEEVPGDRGQGQGACVLRG